MNKISLIVFHKNIQQYPRQWIEKFIHSIKNQTEKGFDVLEIDYGGTNNQIYKGSIFENKQLLNHAEAHNYLLDKSFLLGYDFTFNTNVDDIFNIDRIRIQLKSLQQGYDIVSSNFYRVNENEKIISRHNFSNLNFIFEAKKGHNIIAHPVCAYSKRLWQSGLKLISSEIPRDDFELWKRAYEKGLKIIVLPQFLLSQRIHSNNVSKKK